VINDDYSKAFGADGKLDRSKATDVIAQTTEMKSIIESTTLSMDGLRASIATEYSQSSLIRLNGVNIFRIPGRARQAFSFLKTQSCQLHAVKNGKCSTSWNVRRCRLRKQHRLLLKRKRTAMKWGVRARSV
jgi:hypothetical protein